MPQILIWPHRRFRLVCCRGFASLGHMNAAAVVKMMPKLAQSVAAIPACPSSSALENSKNTKLAASAINAIKVVADRKREENPFGTSPINRHCRRHECNCRRRKISDERNKSRAWIDADASGEWMSECCRRAFPNRMSKPSILQRHYLDQHPNCRNGRNDSHRANDDRQKTSLAWTNS